MGRRLCQALPSDLDGCPILLWYDPSLSWDRVHLNAAGVEVNRVPHQQAFEGHNDRPRYDRIRMVRFESRSPLIQLAEFAGFGVLTRDRRKANDQANIATRL